MPSKVGGAAKMIRVTQPLISRASDIGAGLYKDKLYIIRIETLRLDIVKLERVLTWTIHSLSCRLHGKATTKANEGMASCHATDKYGVLTDNPWRN